MKINGKSVVTGQIKNFFSYYGWPTVCADENDVLYAVCSGHRMGHVCPFGKTLMYKSRNAGKTWSAPTIIEDSYLDDRDAGILYLGNGRMLATNFVHPFEVYKKNYKSWIVESSGKFGYEMLEMWSSLKESDRQGGSFYMISEDFGETWSERKRIPVSCPHGPIKLSDGDILYIGKEMYSGGEEEPDTINAYISKPENIKFVKTGSCPKPDGYEWEKFHEPHCVQLESGRILAVYRSHIDDDGDYFTMYKTYSDDKGKTWSKPEATGICGSPPHLLKLKDGRIILSYARRAKPYGIYARIIEKDGSFGEDELLIDKADDSDIGYPASAELKNGEIVTVFYKREISERYTSIVSVNWSL